MKTYLSFGGGVNSVAMMLLMLDEGWDFEAVFVDHGGDWPETYEYVKMLQDKGYEITVLTPSVRTIDGKVFNNIYDYYIYKRCHPVVVSRGCTARWKVRVLETYQKTPCFVCIGYDFGEIHRAKLGSTIKNVELRFPLIEAEIDREGCKELIVGHGLPVPRKSGCYFCPFQKATNYKELRATHPELYCKLQVLENGYRDRRIEEGKEPIFLKNNVPLSVLVNEDQYEMWEEYKPPCYCGR